MGEAGAGRCSTSVPLTGPRHVVPEYGIVSVLPPSVMDPTPLREKGQFGKPGTVAVPLTVNGTDVPFS
jgi:hypothetical protein